MPGEQSRREMLIAAVVEVANWKPMAPCGRRSLDAALQVLWATIVTAGRDREILPGVPRLYLKEEAEFRRLFPEVDPCELLLPCWRALREFLDDFCVARSVEILLGAVVRCQGTFFFEPHGKGLHARLMPTDTVASELFVSQVLLSVARLLAGIDGSRLQRCSVCDRFVLHDTAAAISHPYDCAGTTGDSNGLPFGSTPTDRV